MTILSEFEEVWFEDFEFNGASGERPNVVSFAALELHSGRTVTLRGSELGERSPLRGDKKVLHACFSGNAEYTCYLALDWSLPVNVLDLSPVFRNICNGRRTPEGKGLIGMLRYYGLSTIDARYKEAMRSLILRGEPFTEEEWREILEYNLSDCTGLQRALPHILTEPKFDLATALHWGEFIKVSAVMEHHGTPIDMHRYKMLADPQLWSAVRDELVPILDKQYGVFVRDSGEWSFSEQLFEAYLDREEIDGWPRTPSGRLDLKEKTFDSWAKAYPQLETLRQLRHMRAKMRRVSLAVGRDGRNRTTLWGFKSKTGRTQPSASEYIFSPAVWLRSLIKPEPGMAVAYIDWSAGEFLIAASKSNHHLGAGNPMLKMYRTGDPYTALAQHVGALPPDASRKDPVAELIRDRFKITTLATQYGIGTVGLAARLSISTIEAHIMLGHHREQFIQYWKWSDDALQHALQTGETRTVMGWSMTVGITELNERSLRNWPIQSVGGDILRLACVWAARHDIKLLAPVHDALLIEAPIERIEADVALMREIMRRASRVVLNHHPGGTHEMRTSADIVMYPDRYVDKRGTEIWETVCASIDKLVAERGGRNEEAEDGTVHHDAAVVGGRGG